MGSGHRRVLDGIHHLGRGAGRATAEPLHALPGREAERGQEDEAHAEALGALGGGHLRAERTLADDALDHVRDACRKNALISPPMSSPGPRASSTRAAVNSDPSWMGWSGTRHVDTASGGVSGDSTRTTPGASR
jgi:hypothetical protein